MMILSVSLLLFIFVCPVKSSELELHVTLKQLRDGETIEIQGVDRKVLTASSLVHCSTSCLRDVSCKAFEYKNQTTNNCVTIHDNNDNSNGGDPLTLVASKENRIFKKRIDYCTTSPCQNGRACINKADGYRCECPSGYKGANCTDVDHCAGDPCQNGGTCINDADGYRCQCQSGYTGSACADVDDCPTENPCQNGGTCVDGSGSFTCNCTENYEGPTCQLNCTHPWCTLLPWPLGDTPDLHIPFELLSEFTGHNTPGFFPGKAGTAIRLIRQQRQWVDLGDVSGYSCFSRPENCGPNGASLTTWINIIDCPNNAGFITTQGSTGTTGFISNCYNPYIIYSVQTTNKLYRTVMTDKPTGWFHLTIIYHGTGNCLSVYYDGELVGEDKTAQMTSPRSSSSGQIVIGRRIFNNDGAYATIEIDELTLWNN